MAALTEEQSLLRDAARGWVQEKSPVAAYRRIRDGNSVERFDLSVWREMANMGWSGVIVPEEFGGSEFGYLSLGLVLEELGRTLTASPLIPTSLGVASALKLGGTAAQKTAWLPKIAEGAIVATLAVDEGPRHDPERIDATVAGSTLSGAKTFVLEGMAANLFVVAAQENGVVELYLVKADAHGVSREAVALMDGRGVAKVSFKDVAVGADDKLTGGAVLLEKVLDRVRAGLAAEMLGMALQAFEMTVDYLKTRVQFGQVIGTFQALQHRAAEMFGALELTRSVVEAALTAIDTDSENVAELVSIAKAKAGATLFLVSNELIQMHGGIGMTDAFDAGLYLKRARTIEPVFGNQAFHKDRFARLNDF